MENPDFEEYCKWTNEPKHLINPVRPVIMFDDWFSEFISKTEWWKVPLFWMPMMAIQLYLVETTLVMTCYLFTVGLLMWTFMEYMLHRFVFHSEDKWLPTGNFAMCAHFLFHGIHHAFPMDKLRLVFPPHMALILYFGVFRPLYSAIVPTYYYHGIMAGTMFGYMSYDMIHYWTHHYEINCNHLKSMKKYHMIHHYRDGEAGFGVSSKIWDRVFGTLLPGY